MDRLAKLIVESISAVSEHQRHINDALASRWKQPSVPEPAMQPSLEEEESSNHQQTKLEQTPTDNNPEPSQNEVVPPTITILPPKRKEVLENPADIMMRTALKWWHHQRSMLIAAIKSSAIEWKLEKMSKAKTSVEQPEDTQPIDINSETVNASPNTYLLRKQLHRRKKQSPNKDDNEELRSHNHELLKEAQRKRLELMDKLRQLDHKVEQIKKHDLANSKVSNNSKEHYLPQQNSSEKSEREKHEQALKLIRKINEEKQEREQRKLKELDRTRLQKQAQLEAMLLAKESESRSRRPEVVVRRSAGPQLSTNNSSANKLGKSNSESTGGLDSIDKSNNLPSLTSKLRRNETSNDPRKELQRPEVNVTVDLTKRSFPKSRVHQFIVQEEREHRNRELRDKISKFEQLQRRNNYTVGGSKQKVVLTPISLSSSVSENRSNELRQTEKKGGEGLFSNGQNNSSEIPNQSCVESANHQFSADHPVNPVAQQENNQLQNPFPAEPAEGDSIEVP